MARIWEVVRLIIIGGVVSLLGVQGPLYSGVGKAEQRDPGRSFALDNGLKVFLYERRDLPLLNIATAVNVGSKDETDETNGLVHVLEHCILFRGTESRTGSEVSRDIRRHGAYFNANTGFDLTLFEISLPSEHADFALENQKEILFRFALNQAELDEEKAVILEEINQMEDDPPRYAMTLLFERLFAGHPYARPVSGRREVVQGATVERLRAFYDKYYVPNNCAMAVVGDFESKEMEAKIRSEFGTLKPSPLPAAGFTRAGPLKKTATIQEKKDVKEAYLAIGYLAPDCNHQDQFVIDVLAEVMGRGINPLLNTALNSRQDLIKTMSMAYFANKLGGALLITMTLDPKNVQTATRETVAFLRRAYNESFSIDDIPGDEKYYAYDYLEGAKNQIRFSAEQAEESGLALASALARFMLLNEREKPGDYLTNINKVRSDDLRRAVSQYLSRGEYVAVSVVPEKRGKRPD